MRKKLRVAKQHEESLVLEIIRQALLSLGVHTRPEAIDLSLIRIIDESTLDRKLKGFFNA